MNLKNITVAALLLAGASMAKEYGMAGCGLGSVVMGKSGSQVLAATTNGTLYSQSIGITIGTLNCTDDGVAMGEREQELFAEANFDLLKQEIAQGEGENLYALASLMGCSDEQGRALSSNLQTLGSNIASDTPHDLLFSIRAVESTQNLCSAN